jgi:hypothetical protein
MSSEAWTALIAALALLISLAQWLQTQRSNRLKSLQGERETLGFEAVAIVHRGKWQQRIPGRRISTPALRALMLSTVFEASDRARIQVYSALEKIRSTHEAKIVSFRGYLGETLEHYRNLKDENDEVIIDTNSFKKRLDQFDAALPWAIEDYRQSQKADPEVEASDL